MRKDNLVLAIILGLLIGTTILFLNTLAEAMGITLERLAQYYMLVIILALSVGVIIVPIYIIYEKIKRDGGLL